MSRGKLQFVSLRTKLVVFATLLVVVPATLYGTLTVWRVQSSLARIVGLQLRDHARNSADRLAAVLDAETASLSSYAQQDVMRDIRVGDFDKRISSFLTSLKRGNPACLDLLVIDPRGRVVAASSAEAIGSEPEWLRSFASGNGGMRGPMVSPLHDRESLVLSAAIPDTEAAGGLLGTLVGLYDWTRETEVVGRALESLSSFGPETGLFILDDAGTVIGGAFEPAGDWQSGRPLGLASTPPLPDHHVDAKRGLVVGQASLAENLPPWRIVVAQPLAVAFAPARETARTLLVTLVATLLAALAVALVAARRVTRPLDALTAAAREIGRGGSPTVPVASRSNDEIGVLAETFDRMAVDLRRAQQELLDAAKFAFVGELAAGVAHEVRTPLGVLRSSAQLLDRSLEERDEDTRELLQLLRDEVDRVDRVINGLLELGRPRELSAEAVPLGQVVLRAADFADAQAREKRVTIARHALDPDPIAVCDPELVYQVALNLLVNSIQMVAPGGHVAIAVVATSNGYTAFEVRDDGPGIPEDQREQIFRPFFTARPGGVGLGLTFVQRVVQEHRGRLSVDSAVGRGTTFRVELPSAGSPR